MGKMLPASVPQQPREKTLALLATGGVSAAVALLGVRGYYLRTLGDPKTNDRGIYDDALFLLSPRTHTSFNANVDPSVFRTHVAKLNAGVWQYQLGIHGLSKPKAQRYEALVQAAPVEVTRDKEGADRGYFGINIHRGGYSTTSSLGCQTVPPEQWPAFIALVKKELRFHGQTTLPYMLVEEPSV